MSLLDCRAQTSFQSRGLRKIATAKKIWDPRRWEAALARVAALVAAAVAAGDVSVPAPAFLRADPVCAAVWG